MANSPDFVSLALELLSGVGPLDARAMFGGHGVYARGVMFGLLDDDELFLKTDDVSRPRFVEAGCRSWVYVGPNGRMENTSYYRPPDGAHEDPDAMGAWAALALDAALRLRAAKAARGKGGTKARPAAKRTAARAKAKAKAKPERAASAPKRGAAKAARPGARSAGRSTRSRGRARPR
jgi:DNA transformation protein